MAARRSGYRLVVVMPENVSEERVRLLRLYGADDAAIDQRPIARDDVIAADQNDECREGNEIERQHGASGNERDADEERMPA